MQSIQPPAGFVLDWLGQWRDKPEHRLPARVARSLADLDRRSEILIGWVQAALISVLGGLYLVAPGTAPTDARFYPVPWALGVYAAFTVMRLCMAYLGRLTLVWRIVSVLVDIGMLMVTIWSFHLQYAQPPAFYLKAPTLLYVFIFIVVRALTFSPLYVLFTGLVAAAGWLGLLALALMAPGGAELVTHDYVQYMNSSRILIGGEVDRVLSILIVTAVLSVAVARARQLLFHAVGDQAAISQLSRFFAPEIAQRLSAADELLHSGDGEQRSAAAMFIDLRGFTTLASQLPPRDLIDILRTYQSIAVPVIHRHNGSITTYLGDGIMVTFGASNASERYCADALRCAHELLHSMANWQSQRQAQHLPAPGVGIGVDSGTVTCGVIGGEGRLEYAIIGNPVNRAAKLQQHTKAAQVSGLASLECYRSALEQGYADGARAHRRLNNCRVNGVAEAMGLLVLDA